MPSFQSLFHMRRKSDAPPNTQHSAESPDDVARKLAMLNIKSGGRPPVAQQDGFVGGFHPAAFGDNGPSRSRGRLPPTFPVAMPPPHPGPPPLPPKMPGMVVTPPADGRGVSRTMEYALSSPEFGVTGPSRPPLESLRPSLDEPPRPRSEPAAYTRLRADPPQSAVPLPLFRDADDPPSLSVPSHASSSRVSLPALQVPLSHPRSRSASSPATPSALSDKVVCSGYTKAKVSKRCTRQKDRSTLPLDTSEWYCFQHLNEMLKPETFRVQGGDVAHYSTFIPEYLSPLAQANLRTEMLRAIAKADRPGYIYVHQIEHFDPALLLYKAGRTVNTKKRLFEWTDQCPSQKKHLVHVYPWPEGADATSLMAANFEPGPPGICSHRLEKLVLIELADLAQFAQYLRSDFRDCTTELKWEGLGKAVHARQPPERKRCKDCGATHREIFEFTRARSGPLVGKELESVIIPVINRWANFLYLHALKED